LAGEQKVILGWLGVDRSRSVLKSLTCDIKGADHSASTAIENVSVDHGGFDIFVGEKFLNSADIVAVLEKVRCKSVAKGMATDMFGDVGRSGGLI